MRRLLAGRGPGLRQVNDVLQRRTGWRLTRPAAPPLSTTARPPGSPEDRLVPSPVFIISTVRSGSTLLRAVLDSHSQIHAPIELHLRNLRVAATSPPAEQAMHAVGLNGADLEHLLWDRVLHRSLHASGKAIVVDKTPGNVFAIDRLAVCWPEARYLHLLRHPVSIARSWHESDPLNRPMDAALRHVARYGKAVQAARRTHPGLTLRYEDLLESPVEQTSRVCAFLGVAPEPEMLEYGSASLRAGEFVRGIGDWSNKIRSGRIQAGRPLPADEDVPVSVRDLAAAWGYLPAPP